VWDGLGTGVRPGSWDDVARWAPALKAAGHPVGIGLSQDFESTFSLLGMMHAYGAAIQDEQANLTINRRGRSRGRGGNTNCHSESGSGVGGGAAGARHQARQWGSGERKTAAHGGHPHDPRPLSRPAFRSRSRGGQGTGGRAEGTNAAQRSS
jgi:hypothetical protein